VGKKFCGEGFPEWTQANKTFPAPHTFNLTRDEEGNPKIEDCLKRSFVEYYFSEDVAQHFQNLYDNKDGILDSFAAFWGYIADEFKDEPNVIGYDFC
jgi:endoglycosylceramidase